MADDLKSASHEDVAEALAFALCYTGRKRVHAPSNLSSNLDRCGFVSMKKPPELGGAQLGRGHDRGK